MTYTFPSGRTCLLAVAAVVLSALMLLSACGGGDDDDDRGDSEPTATEEQDGDSGGDDEPAPDEGDGDFDVCALMTEEEVADIIGFDTTSSSSNDFDPFFGCKYDFDSGNVSISVYRDDREVVEAFYELTADAEQVDGVGDRAQYTELFDQLEVLDGNYDITVSVFSFDGESEVDTLELDKELAQLLLDRLP